MKILVTGGAGFIASNIADTYLAQGHRVVVIDNMSHGFKANVPAKAKFYKVDIRDLNAVCKIMKKEKPDVINHHAAIAEVAKSVTDPIPTLEVNVQGTVNLLLTGGEIGITKFIFASTGGAIYGATNRYPISEKAKPEPESPYGLSKLLGEQAVEYYARVHKFKYTIFRYPNVYGPRQDPKGEAGVIAIFTELLQHKKQPIIYGNGKQTRDYVYVQDIVQANRLALRKGHNDMFNLGRGEEVSTQQVYETIAGHFITVKKPKYKKLRAGEVERSSLHTAKAKRVLDWKSFYTFEQGIQEYIDYKLPTK